jgi:hypothetical protein
MTNLLKQKAQKAREGDVKRGAVLQTERVARGLLALDTEAMKCLLNKPAQVIQARTPRRAAVWGA